ncbi:MAG TPA: hypothetical protein VGN81_04655 [Pseudonocardiaceae bacterium]|jgi:hypothetical protein
MSGRHRIEDLRDTDLTPLNDEPTTVETDPLIGRDDHPAPPNQPWRRIAKEVKKSANE